MKKKLVVVGIGSSAGGLEALQKLFTSLDNVENMAFVVAQHLSPNHKSMMVELLQRVTGIPVLEIKNGMVIKERTIYITPENTDIYISDGKIYLKNIHHTFGPKPSVNYFFTSLAGDFKERAIGIILSGTGSDGSYGVRAIKAEGGITIAQSPQSSKYDGMPISAINTGKVDTIIPIDNMASEVQRLAHSIDNRDIATNLTQNHMQNLFKILFEETSVDFSEYKKSTITRRIQRRMAALKIENLPDYIKELEMSSEEINNLYNDILIGVTSFFRDKQAFEVLRVSIENLIEKKEQGEDIRIWVVGCSTGEEAYSIAIILNEILQEKIKHYRIKIFATDIDEESLKIARAGVYSEASLMEVEKKIVNKYFKVLKHQYEIKKELREMIVFSKHNIISDSPFLRLDLITCRNMMIYFSSDLQSRLFPILHYSLNDNALLMLGKSEAVGESSNLFTTLDRVNKIYKAQYIGTKNAPKIFKASISSEYYRPQIGKSKKSELEVLDDLIIHAKDKYLLNKAVIINSTNEIIYTKGEIPYLSFAEGKATKNIFKLLGENLSIELRTLINKAYKNNSIEVSKYIAVNLFDIKEVYVRMVVTPVEGIHSEDNFYVIFFQTEEKDNLSGFIVDEESQDESVSKLKNDLETTKAHLQNVIEELETSYEETQSLNEELQSSNEELQSSNEELETTNEELQSTNEELQTAYAELKMLYNEKDDKNKRLEDLAEKLKQNSQNLRDQKDLTEAIINSAPVAITMVDEHGMISFANENALKLYRLSKNELQNKSFDANAWNITTYDDKPFPREKLPFMVVKKTFDKVFDIEHAVSIDGNKLYLSISGAPLFDSEGRFKGAVFSVVDNTKNIIAMHNIESYQKSLEENNQLVEAIKSGKNISFGSSFEIFQQLMGTLSIKWRNDLNKLSLYLDSFKEKNLSKLELESINALEKIEDIQLHLTQELNNLHSFFISSLMNQNLSNIQILKETLNIFEESFEELNIQVVDELKEEDEVLVQTHKIKSIYFLIIEFLLHVKKLSNTSSQDILTLTSQKKKLLFSLDCCIEEIKDQANAQNLKDEFESLFHTEIKISCIEKKLIVELSF